MKTEQVTLRDIARATGVSAATVHRALQGKEGVSSDMRAKIQSTAAQMRYRASHMAAAPKREKIRFAVVFPEPRLENRYYYLNLWQGVRRFLKRVPELNIEIMEFPYPIQPGSNGAILQKVYENHIDEISGVITNAVEHSQSSLYIEKFAAENIPVALVGADIYKENCFCCIKTYDEVVGSLAAELLTACQPKDFRAKIIVTGNIVGNLAMLDQFYNARSFERHLELNSPNITTFSAYNTDVRASSEQVRDLLTQFPDIYAIYACSARHTIQMCSIALELGLQGRLKVVGNDVFPESAEMIKDGVLTAVIDKKVSCQSYLAIQTLVDYIVKGEGTPGSTRYVRPGIVMKSNVDVESTAE